MMAAERSLVLKSILTVQGSLLFTCVHVHDVADIPDHVAMIEMNTSWYDCISAEIEHVFWQEQRQSHSHHVVGPCLLKLSKQSVLPPLYPCLKRATSSRR